MSCDSALYAAVRMMSEIPISVFVQGGTSFVDLLCFFCLVFVMPLCVCLYVPCGHLLGKD